MSFNYQSFIMNDFFSQCLDLLKREDIKYKMKDAFEPVIALIMYEVKPYIYIGIFAIFATFIMILAIMSMLIIILCNKLS
jgi:hypothetical protein